MALLVATLAGASTAQAASLPSRLSVSGSRGLSIGVIAAATVASRDAGARLTVVRQGTVDLVSHRRGPRVLEAPPADMAYPVSLSSVDGAVVDSLLGREVGVALRRGEVVLGKTSAAIRGAKVGDQLDVVGWNSRRVRLRVGAVVSDDRALASEMLVSHQVSTTLGVTRASRVVVWGGNRGRMEQALRLRLPKGQSLSRSWSSDQAGDEVLSQAKLKAVLGEFAVRTNGSKIIQDPRWLSRNIVRESVPIIGAVWCNRTVMPALRKALAEVQRRGLSTLIDVADTRRNGGCFGGAREVRTDTGSSGRNLSRHSWGAAIDINPATNPFGGAARLDPRIVAIFRHQGFAWGGTWQIPDGMHFEYVG
ncbi:MAG: hypothetical protein JWL70_2959 [Acidimicrobiia bacterium]|nr:hypothetical protein [Acidimicrobiia bacterium]